ncbi:tRNA modification GTPase MnmE [Aquisphaera giovannonii]|uniref:tRNA modification GTPase MnmE n=1 Tax=Aquisphaera giovannonii TaxID=406548 RepID=A0A5B9WB26_9BACT|nr:tRNA modification GTPase MnmE [Aquisphaera giovannonii]
MVQVWGPGAVRAVEACFRPARGGGLMLGPAGRLRLGRMGRGAGDEVVAVVLEGEPPAVEIQCHGGPAATELVLEALEGAGVGRAGVEQWAAAQAATRIRAEALVDLPHAPTLRAAEILAEQAGGALDRELEGLDAEIRGGRLDRAIGRADRLLADGRVGVRLREGWRAILAGAPNVGKSRLLNALAGFRRAIVAPTPGTTRDVVTATAAFDGWPVLLADTAGQRAAEDPVERHGIDRARRMADSADLVVLVLDLSRPLEESLGVASGWPRGRSLVVANKADLPAAWGLDEPSLRGLRALRVSAERGDGLDDLTAAIAKAIVPGPPAPCAGVPFRARQVEGLGRVRAALRAGDVAAAIRAIESLRGWA